MSISRTGERLLAGSFLAASLAAVILLVVHYAPRAGSPVAQKAPVPRALAAVIALPRAPSVFDSEAAMTPRALLDRWEPFVTEASKRFGVSKGWIRAVIRMESAGRTMMGENIPIVSSAGAVGIMQVMPQTYAEMRLQYGLGADPFDPHDNVIAGTAYLKWLFAKYGNPGMFAAYNDGPGNVDAFLADSRALPGETNAYVTGISKILGQPATDFAHFTGAQLTRPDGTKVEIEGPSVSAVRAAFPGEYAPGVLSVVSMGKARQGVREDVATATAALRAHGAKI